MPVGGKQQVNGPIFLNRGGLGPFSVIRIVALLSGGIPVSLANAEPVAAFEYPRVRITVNQPLNGDGDYRSFRRIMGGVVRRRDHKTLIALVSPQFTWSAPDGTIGAGKPATETFDRALNFVPSLGIGWRYLARLWGETHMRGNGDGEYCTGAETVPVDHKTADEFAERLSASVAHDPSINLSKLFILERPTPVFDTPKSGARQIATLQLEIVAHDTAGNDPANYAAIILPDGRRGYIRSNSHNVVQSQSEPHLCVKRVGGEWRISSYYYLDE